MFSDVLIEALDQVDDIYFGNGRWTRAEYYDLNRYQAAQLTRFVTRHLERTFCYELYFQLRLRLPDPHNAEGLTLQAELAKSKIPDWLATRFELRALDAMYFPDFLYHRPFSGDRQVAVVEVKAKPDVGGTALRKDLNKLGQFVDRYGYEQAIMLAVNSNSERVHRLIRNNRHRLQTDAQTEQIMVVTKESAQHETLCCTLADLLT